MSIIEMLDAEIGRIRGELAKLERARELLSPAAPPAVSSPEKARRRPRSGGGAAARPAASATEKTCTKCGKKKPLEDFNVQAAGALGREARCKTCKRAYLVAHRANAKKAASKPKDEEPEPVRAVSVSKARSKFRPRGTIPTTIDREVRCPEAGCGTLLPLAKATQHSWEVHRKRIFAEQRDGYYEAAS